MSAIGRPETPYQPISPRFGAELNDTVLLDLTNAGVDAVQQQLAAERGVVVTRDTGRNALYANSGFTARIQDVTRAESDALLEMLFDHITDGVGFQIRVQWKPDTVVFWDNRVVRHMAAWDYLPEVRHGYRATAIGEQPYLAEPHAV